MTKIESSLLNDIYDERTIMLHWLSAALVAGLWLVGQSIDFFPRGAPRVTVRSLHIVAGLMLAVVLVLRLAWRRQGGVKLAPVDPGAAGKLAVGAHHMLYLLLTLVVLAGVANVWVRGDTLFGIFNVPAFDPSNKDLRELVGDLHGLGANILLAIAGLHAAMAVWHHLMLKDGVLRRMLPRLAKAPNRTRP